MSKGKIAKEYFLNGLNCSQAVLCAFCDETGLSYETAHAISSSFGGGMGRLREVCGAVSGMFMVVGLLYGNTNTKAEQYKIVQDLAAKFRNENGSIICKELLGVGGAQPPVPDERTTEYYKKRPCPELVEMAADILEEYIEKREKETANV